MEEITLIEESIYGLMWKMELNEKLVVTISAWNDVRAFANRLKNTMGRLYTVNRMRTGRTKLDYLLIRRIQ